MGDKILVAFLSAFFGLSASIGFSFYQSTRAAPAPLGVIKLDQIMADHLRSIASVQMDDEERDKSAARFASALAGAIEHVAATNGVTLLVAPAVVSNVTDYTGEVQGAIYQALGLGSKAN